MVMSSMQIAAMSPVAQQMGGMQSPGNYMQQITPPGLQGMGYGGPPGAQIAPPAFSTGIGAPSMGMAGPSMGYMDPGSMAAGGVSGLMGQGFGAMLPGTGGAGALGERMTGTMLNAASTMGTGMGWLNTGAGIAGMLGVGGAGMATMGALPVTGAIAAAGYGLNQMSQGFQQRQQVNQVLRSNFGGMMGVGQGRGGTGFSSEEMGGISTMMREMGTQDIFTNMEELTRVMDKTSQMGMYRGIQSAKDFKDRFRKTVGTLKEIATTMNTTLEEATTFMQQGRQMGFFSGQEINANMMQTRFGAGATGLSVGQVQQMGQVGSQMGRMMGMRGRQGARAMQGIGLNIAQGMEMGVLSDEMMSEATGGLMGGEAATAMAQSVMQANNKWMRSRAGKVMVAGLWDPETGGIDQAALKQVQSGQLSIRELRDRARRNIQATGGNRSEFFSQRERIAGMIQEQGGGGLGGFGIMAEHYARRRGMELTDPAMQRQLRRRFGLSQSQVEAMTRLHQKLPQIQERSRARIRQQMDQAVRSKTMESTGLAGLERRISRRWEERVENPLRQIADDFTTQVNKGIEGLVGDMVGQVNLQMDAATKQAYEEFQRSGRRIGSSGVRIMTQKEQSAAISRLTKSGVRGGSGIGGMIGRALGTRPTATIRQQAEALGLGQMDGAGFRLKDGRTPEIGELQGLVRSANQQIMEGPGIELEEGELRRMGASAAQIVTEAFAGAGEARAYGLRAQSAGPQERMRLQKQRIQLLRKKDKRIDRYFAEAGDDWIKQQAALNQLEEESQINRTFMAAPAGGTGVSTDDLEGIVRMSREREEQAVTGLANLRFKRRREERKILGRTVMTRDFGEEREGGRLDLDEADVAGLFQNRVVNKAIRAYVRGDKKTSDKALSDLRLLSSNQVTVENQGQRSALEQIFQREITNDATSERRLKHELGAAIEQQDLRSNLAIQRREQEVGQEMVRGLRKNKWRYEKGTHAKAMSQVEKIAELRAKGGPQAMQEARELEQKFLSNPENLGNRELQETLAGIEGLEYLSHGVNEAARVAARIMEGGEGFRRGATKETRLIETALQAAGLEDVDITQRQMKGLITAAQKGEGSGLFMERLRTLTGKKGKEFGEKFSKQAEMFKQIAGIMSDKEVTEEEARRFAGRHGGAAAARLRMEGAADKPPTSAQQEKMIGYMQKQYMIQKQMAQDAMGKEEFKALMDKVNTSGEGGGGGEDQTV